MGILLVACGLELPTQPIREQRGTAVTEKRDGYRHDQTRIPGDNDEISVFCSDGFHWLDLRGGGPYRHAHFEQETPLHSPATADGLGQRGRPVDTGAGVWDWLCQSDEEHDGMSEAAQHDTADRVRADREYASNTANEEQGLHGVQQTGMSTESEWLTGEGRLCYSCWESLDGGAEAQRMCECGAVACRRCWHNGCAFCGVWAPVRERFEDARRWREESLPRRKGANSKNGIDFSTWTEVQRNPPGAASHWQAAEHWPTLAQAAVDADLGDETHVHQLADEDEEDDLFGFR